MTDLFSKWNYPTTVRFGAGRIAELAEACRGLGMARPLIVTDPGLAASPLVRNALALLEAGGLAAAVFSAIKPNPVGRNISDGVAAFRAGGHDGVVAFGGGSALDAGKTIALMVGQSRPLWDFVDEGDNWTRVDPAGMAPVVAVPTTAGTGSEVGRAAVVTQEETQRKLLIFHPKMLPGLVIADPELTLGLPRHLTAWTGLDALAHCLEAFCAPSYHPMADGIALEGLRLIRTWLPVVVNDGQNLEARSHMLAAAAMGAAAFQKGLGAIHSLSHPVGAVYDTHHGRTNALFMPYVLAFNRPAIEERMARLAAYIGLERADFQGMVEWTLELRRTMDVPHTLGEMGIGTDRFDEIAAMAEADPSTPTNPVPADDRAMRRMLEMAASGSLDV
ncbi:MAG TPA: iron-containing alcohol dehydrogenase [Alphaproteobacteria bacterium]|nr:iron-containing alcohol dehydrogenase [Alphaproteobacteria bacterium]